MTAELRSIYSGPIRRALDRLQVQLNDTDQTGNPIPAPGAYAKLVGVGAMKQPTMTIAANVWGNVTKPLGPIVTKTGRIYRIFFKVRALSMPSPGSIRYKMSTNVGGSLGDAYIPYSTPYSSLNTEWLFNGSGVANTFEVQLQGSSDLTVYGDADGFFYVEDLGTVQPP